MTDSFLPPSAQPMPSNLLPASGGVMQQTSAARGGAFVPQASAASLDQPLATPTLGQQAPFATPELSGANFTQQDTELATTPQVIEPIPLTEPSTQVQAAPSNTTPAPFETESELEPPFDLPVSFTLMEFQDFLRTCTELGVSDLTIQSGDYVWGEYKRVHTPMTDRRLEHSEVERAIGYMYGSTGVSQLISGEATDFEYEIAKSSDDFQEVMRFRCNATASRVGGIANGASVTMRTIPGLPVKWEVLGVPNDIHENFFPQYGLVLILGTTGSGKSTLLAAGNRYRLENANRPVKIITYEEPIEAVYTGLAEGRMPQPSQVQIGSHLRSFADAGRNAMRRKADIIIMGESRDIESVSACFEMALSGHAVYSTLHADTPAECFARMVSFFPEDSQPAAANKLLGTTRLIVAQKLARRINGSVVAIQSWLVVDREVATAFSQIPFYQWGAETAKITQRRGTDFESQTLPLLKTGEVSFSTFREVVNMTIAEAIDYLTERNLAHLIPHDVHETVV